MTQSLEKRINGNADKIIREVELYGWTYVCDEVLHCAPDTLQRWYQKQPDCEGKSIFTLKPMYPHSPGMSLGEQIVIAIKADRARDEIEKSKLRDEIQKMVGRIKFLEWQLAQRDVPNHKVTTAILEACEAEI